MAMWDHFDTTFVVAQGPVMVNTIIISLLADIAIGLYSRMNVTRSRIISARRRLGHVFGAALGASVDHHLFGPRLCAGSDL